VHTALCARLPIPPGSPPRSPSLNAGVLSDNKGTAPVVPPTRLLDVGSEPLPAPTPTPSISNNSTADERAPGLASLDAPTTGRRDEVTAGPWASTMATSRSCGGTISPCSGLRSAAPPASEQQHRCRRLTAVPLRPLPPISRCAPGSSWRGASNLGRWSLRCVAGQLRAGSMTLQVPWARCPPLPAPAPVEYSCTPSPGHDDFVLRRFFL